MNSRDYYLCDVTAHVMHCWFRDRVIPIGIKLENWDIGDCNDSQSFGLSSSKTLCLMILQEFLYDGDNVVRTPLSINSFCGCISYEIALQFSRVVPLRNKPLRYKSTPITMFPETLGRVHASLAVEGLLEADHRLLELQERLRYIGTREPLKAMLNSCLFSWITFHSLSLLSSLFSLLSDEYHASICRDHISFAVREGS